MTLTPEQKKQINESYKTAVKNLKRTKIEVEFLEKLLKEKKYRLEIHEMETKTFKPR